MRSLLPDTRGLPRRFWPLLAGTLVNRLGTFVVPYLILYLTSQRGLAIETAGLMASFVGVGSLASGPAGGYLADRLGRRPTIGLATSLGATAMLAMAFARSLPFIGVAAVALGFLGELHRPAVSAMVADVVSPGDRPRAYGLLYWAVNLGTAVALPLGGLAATHGYALLFVGDACTTLFFGALVVFRVAETRPRTAAHGSTVRPRYWLPYRDGPFLLFAAWCFPIIVVFLQDIVTVPLEMRRHGVSPSTYGWLLAINAALIVFVQPSVSRWAQHWARERTLAFGALAIGIGMAMTGLARGSVPLYALSIVVWTGGEMAFMFIASSFVADLAPATVRGSYQGAYQIIWGAAAFVAPLSGGLVLGRLGPGVLWSACAACGLLGAATARRVAGRRVDASRADQATRGSGDGEGAPRGSTKIH